MATKPNAKDYALPPSCISGDENAEGVLAKHLEPLCLSLAERVLLYNQEVLFLQGKEILQGLTKLKANGVAAAAGDGGLAPAAGLGPAAAAGAATVTLAPPMGRARVAPAAAASVSDVKIKAEQDDREAGLPALTQVDKEQLERAIKRARALLLEEVGEDGKASVARKQKSKDNLSEAGSSETEGREQERTKAQEIAGAKDKLAEATEGINTIGTSNNWEEVDRPWFEEQRQKALLELRELGVAEEHAHDSKVPRGLKGPVRKTAAKNRAKAHHGEQKAKRVRNPLSATTTRVERENLYREHRQIEGVHRNKKLKVEVNSEPEDAHWTLKLRYVLKPDN